ncbi:hypothetical protein [Brachyspira pilosicoli]|uniref:Uncharacterized protein n=1 Tax=Brachyspira pilosicoli TaxID=52584 RepID=A0A5C8ERY0_BRAPL|nr:hypothetical protein [Brachyspira pilosicoli]TXJ39844.1 hypothetical protein EPJ72_09250 [Brachyspira pilosicoli]
MAVKLFSEKELQKCTTKEEVEAYFDSLGIEKDDYETKIDALTKACNSKSIKYFGDISLEKKYNDILVMFLDEEVRMYRGF